MGRLVSGLRTRVVMEWQTSRFRIDLHQPRVMAIVNATPDSFAERAGTCVEDVRAVCDRCLEEGADILDIGGESTRPGATPPSLDEELARVVPALRHAVTLGVPVSVDTSRPEVMAAALDLGVDIVNDVRALQLPGALDAVAAHPRAGVCLMFRPPTGEVRDPEDSHALFERAREGLASRARAAELAGIQSPRIVLDPGYGFGAHWSDNLVLARQQRALRDALGYPLLVGWSRKGTLGHLTGQPVSQRQAASLGAALAAVAAGASIVRVHDVRMTVDALKVWMALQPGSPVSALRA